jgi:hypothetical protein
MPLGLREVVRRLGYHRATEATISAFEDNRHRFIELTLWLDENLPDGREKTNSLDNLQQSLFWANASVAYTDRSEKPPLPVDMPPGHYMD